MKNTNLSNENYYQIQILLIIYAVYEKFLEVSF